MTNGSSWLCRKAGLKNLGNNQLNLYFAINNRLSPTLKSKKFETFHLNKK
jgi:hypothetical protein